MLALLILAQSAAAPTVGDTIWIRREIRLPARVTIRPGQIAQTDEYLALAPPRVTRREALTEVAYPIVVWSAGRHEIRIPPSILVRPDGWSDTLPGWNHEVIVASVLPDSVPRDSLNPMPAQDPLSAPRQSLLPPLVLVLPALLVVWLLRRRWVRRGTAPEPGPPRDTLRVPVEEWLEQGEVRLALDHCRNRLNLLRGGPERDQLLDRLSAIRYAAEPSAEARALVRDAMSLLGEERP
jgi:hypothetical protein